MSKHGQIGQAAMKADMDRKTARKYVEAGMLPSEMARPRDWRTRPDPFEEHWPELEERLRLPCRVRKAMHLIRVAAVGAFPKHEQRWTRSRRRGCR